mmetsp:Transcript_16795/g.54671  ORF Transcript_16795/g.54671 Transcript_16795/m.54671 type:complete len:251 (-) Transcript_16795:1701-2453(-)
MNQDHWTPRWAVVRLSQVVAAADAVRESWFARRTVRLVDPPEITTLGRLLRERATVMVPEASKPKKLTTVAVMAIRSPAKDSSSALVRVKISPPRETVPTRFSSLAVVHSKAEKPRPPEPVDCEASILSADSQRPISPGACRTTAGMSGTSGPSTDTLEAFATKSQSQSRRSQMGPNVSAMDVTIEPGTSFTAFSTPAVAWDGVTQKQSETLAPEKRKTRSHENSTPPSTPAWFVAAVYRMSTWEPVCVN